MSSSSSSHKRNAPGSFGSRSLFAAPRGHALIYRLEALEKAGLGLISRLPFSIKILLESVLRQVDGNVITDEDAAVSARWNPRQSAAREVSFKPARVVLQDFTGVPAVVDLAAMRSALKRLGGELARINPLIPVDLVIDHAVQVGVFGTPTALQRNAEIEFTRNRERYEFLRWGSGLSKTSV
jgi:aconitate hydratase